MLFIYYIEIKHIPKFKNGAFRRLYLSCKARKPSNAIRQAMQYCKETGIEAISFETTEEGIPASRKDRFKWMQKLRDEKLALKELLKDNYRTLNLQDT